MEVSGRRLPFPALPPLAPDLAVGAQPGAFGGAFPCQREQVVVGRTRFRDGANQNRAPAAFIESVPIAGIAK